MQTVHLKGELGERFGEKWSMNVNKVQDIFLHRAKMNSLACHGKWDASLENG